MQPASTRLLRRGGLDWLVATAPRYGLRLILVLTDGRAMEQGGMWQYMRWLQPNDTVTAFYTNDTYKVRRCVMILNVH